MMIGRNRKTTTFLSMILAIILLFGTKNIVYASDPNSNIEKTEESNLEQDKQDITIEEPVEEDREIDYEDWDKKASSRKNNNTNIDSSEIFKTLKQAFFKLIEGFKIFLNFLLEKDVFRKLADFFKSVAKALLELIESLT